MKEGIVFVVAAALGFFATRLAWNGEPAPSGRGGTDRDVPTLPVVAEQRPGATAPGPRTRDRAAVLQDLGVADDDVTAATLTEGAGRAGFELLQAAWLEHVGTSHPEPADCLAGVAIDRITLRLQVVASVDLVVVRDARVVDPLPDPARRCLDAWFAGEATVAAEQHGLPFPDGEIEFDVTVPTRLGPYVAER